MNPCNQSDREQLQRLLNESLPDAVESRLSDHVATCPACQNELESLAAVQDWWIEASQRLCKSSAELASLRLEGIDRHAASTGNSRGGWTAIDDALRNVPRVSGGANSPGEFSDDMSASDFAVDFLEPSDDASVLGRLGEYEIIEVIGRGGMGIVLKGFQKELNRFVAVKVLSPHLATSGAARQRFAREAQATAAVVNSHVMAIHSVHASSKLPYLVMPFVACESLQQRLDHRGPLDLKDVLRIGMQTALGLAAAHAQGLVHRDVKPANILLETNVDRVMLTDFGLARSVDDATLTRTGIIAGTPQYMSPEQANGDAVDHRSDLFSLGSVLYAMSTARPPFRAETTFGVLRRIRETDPRPIREINSDIPEWFERIVMNLLAKNRERRITTAIEVATLLEQCLAHVQQPTTVPLPVTVPIVHNRSVKPTHSLKTTHSLKKSHDSKSSWLLALVPIVFFSGAWMLWPRAKPNLRGDPPSAVANEPVTGITESKAVTNTIDSRFDWNQTQLEIIDVEQTMKQMETSVQSDLKSEEMDRQSGQQTE